MAMAYFRIEADGATFQAHVDAQTGDITLLVGSSENPEHHEEVHISRNTAEMLARGFMGLAEEDDD